MNLTKELTQLLLTRKEVHISGLGKLYVPEEQEAKNREPDAGSPPRNTGKKTGNYLFPFVTSVLFSEKFDKKDTALDERIAQVYKLRSGGARYEIDKFVIKIKQALSRNGQFELPGLVTLVLDKNGRVAALPDGPPPRLYGLTPVNALPANHGNTVEAWIKKIRLQKPDKPDDLSGRNRLIKPVIIGALLVAVILLILFVLFKILAESGLSDGPANEAEKILSLYRPAFLMYNS